MGRKPPECLQDPPTPPWEVGSAPRAGECRPVGSRDLEASLAPSRGDSRLWLQRPRPSASPAVSPAPQLPAPQPLGPPALGVTGQDLDGAASPAHPGASARPPFPRSLGSPQCGSGWAAGRAGRQRHRCQTSAARHSTGLASPWNSPTPGRSGLAEAPCPRHPTCPHLAVHFPTLPSPLPPPRQCPKLLGQNAISPSPLGAQAPGAPH